MMLLDNHTAPIACPQDTNAVVQAYAKVRQDTAFLSYVGAVLLLCPRGGRSCQLGVEQPHAALWLSLHGVRAEGVDACPSVVMQAQETNAQLQGYASFRRQDPLRLYDTSRRHYQVIHHQGLVDTLTDIPCLHSALAQQVACARWVVFLTTPLPVWREAAEDKDVSNLRSVWEERLAPFDVTLLLDCGDIVPEARGQLLCTLRGQAVDSALRDRMLLPYEHTCEEYKRTNVRRRQMVSVNNLACMPSFRPPYRL